MKRRIVFRVAGKGLCFALHGSPMVTIECSGIDEWTWRKMQENRRDRAPSPSSRGIGKPVGRELTRIDTNQIKEREMEVRETRLERRCMDRDRGPSLRSGF